MALALGTGSCPAGRAPAGQPHGPAMIRYSMIVLDSRAMPYAVALNNRGQALASGVINGQSGVIWDRGQMRKVARPGARLWVRAMNNRGEVVGWWFRMPEAAGGLLYRQGKAHLFRPLFGIVGINDKGLMIGRRPVLGGALFCQDSLGMGYVSDQRGRWIPLWSRTAIRRLGLKAPWVWVVPTALNDAGQVTGFLYEQHALGGSTYIGFLWDHGHVHLLRPPPPPRLSHEYDCQPRAINSSGVIVGEGLTPRPDTDDGHAFQLKDGIIQDLGALGGHNSAALALNDSGSIVGWTETHGGARHAFLYRAHQMLDLNDLVGRHPGLVLNEAVAINATGQILVNAQTPSGKNRAVLLTPHRTN